MNAKSIEAVLAFVEAVNAGSAVQLGEMMTEDHVFVDSDGTECRGKSKMVLGWGEYFAMVPDYKIAVREKFAAGATVIFAGEAEGTFVQDGLLKPENHWKVPAAWRAVVKGRRVAVWQVYVNPEPLSRILERVKEK